MKKWMNEPKSKFKNVFAQVNAIGLVSFSEYLALIPYLLRSLRIKKMFNAREKYAREDKIPRIEIQRWAEWKMILYLSSFLAIMSITVTVLSVTGIDHSYWFISTFFIGGVLDYDGKLKPMQEVTDLYNRAISHFMATNGI